MSHITLHYNNNYLITDVYSSETSALLLSRPPFIAFALEIDASYVALRILEMVAPSCVYISLVVFWGLIQE